MRISGWRHVGWVAVLAAWCASVAPEAWAVEAPLVQAVVVTNVGPGQLDESLVLAYLSHRTGEPLDRSRLSADLRRLLDSGRFANATVEAEPVGDALRLVYSVANRWKLSKPLEVKGHEHFRKGKIRDFMALEVGTMVDEQVLAAGAKRVEREYRDDFFPNAHVRWALIPEDATQGLARVKLTIDEGSKAKVKKLVFEGNEELDDDTLKRLVKPLTWWNPISWFKRVHYDSQALEDARLTVQKEYRDRGYLDARVATPRVVPLKDAGRLRLEFDIVEGVCYRLGALTVTGSGVALFPQEDFRAVAKLKQGQIAGEGAIRTAGTDLRDYFGSRGYIDTSVIPRLETDATNATVAISYEIEEGPLVSIRNIVIRGNTRTRDKVIRRELLVYPGEIYNEVKVRQGERVLNNLGYFDTVRNHHEDTRIPSEKDLVYTVDEKRTGQFMIGAGYSSVDQIIGFMEIQQGNFDLFGWPHVTGGGQKLKLRTEFSERRNEYTLSFVEPWFLNRKLSLGLDLYRSEVDYDDYELNRTGAAVSLARPLPGPNRVQLQYRIERNEISNVTDTNRYIYADETEDDYYFTQEEDWTKSSLGLTLTHDTRNNPFVPTRGKRAVLGAEVAGGPMGFDTDLYDLSAVGMHYTPLWWKHVLTLRTRWETVEAYGDSEEVPISERLFAGGGRTIRGYDYRDVGPKVVRADDPGVSRHVGGQSLATATAEYSIPIVSALRIATFYDIGNVWRDAYEFELDNLASSAGVGLRLDLPGFPIRIDRAWALEKDSNLTDTDDWSFWIGFD
jgi:outer membrane protein insertion porin family